MSTGPVIESAVVTELIRGYPADSAAGAPEAVVMARGEMTEGRRRESGGWE